mmetsp:Transcript_11942/g.15490  ORF Transcript_11942/g.15490 Transcript_11942/m.15490 type:complete len:180 (+) Transcript_11942:146-685(+)
MQRLTNAAKAYAGEPWFPLFVGFCNMIDTFILVVPNDVLIGAAVLAQPHRWLYCALAQTLGCAIGCVLFCLLALYNPQGIKDNYPSVFESSSWERAESFYQSYGLVTAVVGGGILPFHPFLFVGALSGISMVQLVLAIALGRLVRNVGICYTLAKAPDFSISSLFERKNDRRRNRRKNE